MSADKEGQGAIRVSWLRPRKQIARWCRCECYKEWGKASISIRRPQRHPAKCAGRSFRRLCGEEQATRWSILLRHVLLFSPGWPIVFQCCGQVDHFRPQCDRSGGTKYRDRASLGRYHQCRNLSSDEQGGSLHNGGFACRPSTQGES